MNWGNIVFAIWIIGVILYTVVGMLIMDDQKFIASCHNAGGVVLSHKDYYDEKRMFERQSAAKEK